MENVTLNLRNESLEKAYNKLVASRGTTPNVATEDLEEPTPSKDRANYPNIIYWYKHEQLAERRRHEQDRLLNGALSANRWANENVMFWFLQHSDSTVLDGGEVRKICAKAKSQWLTLCKKYGDVGSPWTNVSPNYQLEFFIKMEHKFPLLRLCDGHYKTEAVAFADYSHWHSKNKFEYMRRSKTMTMSHLKTKTQTTSKSESDTDANSEVNQSRKRRQSSCSVSPRKLQCRKMAQEEDEDSDEDNDNDNNDDNIDDNDNDDEDEDEDDEYKDDNKGKEDKEVDKLMEDGEVTSSVKPKPRPAYAGAPIAPSPADTPVPITEQNAVAPQATPTEVTPTAAMPPEVTLSTATPLRATTPGQITVASEVVQVSAEATNETHKQQELDAKGAAESSSA
ncbi:hypothetical protein EI94DRAFT_1800193 [Lactarius quietus]|nr:hypothetical protein EI94DRAFT_1800193 [Lactarius quietus]